MKKKLFSLLLIIVFALSSCNSSTKSEMNVNFKIAEDEVKIITFGRQDSVPITWYVISENDENMILLSEKVLDAMPYNKGNYVSWEKSSLHDYLNGQFIESYFNEEEKEKLLTTNDTDKEKVTMLSIKNLTDLYNHVYYFYGNTYDDDKFLANKKIVAKPTDYLKRQEILETFDNKKYAEYLNQEVDERYDFANGSVPYWLLDLNNDTKAGTIVNALGYITITEVYDTIGIRPIIRIKK